MTNSNGIVIIGTGLTKHFVTTAEELVPHVPERVEIFRHSGLAAIAKNHDILFVGLLALLAEKGILRVWMFAGFNVPTVIEF